MLVQTILEVVATTIIIDNNNSNTEPECLEPSKPVEQDYSYIYQQPDSDTDTTESDSDEECPVNERLKIALSKDGSMTKVRASKVGDKGLHIPEFLSKERLKGKFDITKVKDLEYEDRLDYLRNKDNLPDEVVFETQDKIVEFLSAVPKNSSQMDSVVQTIKTTRAGGSYEPTQNLAKKKFFREMLEQYSPDWDERVNYQNKQVEFYRSGFPKQNE